MFITHQFNIFMKQSIFIGIFKRLDEEQYHNRTPFSIVKLSAWDDDEMDDLKCALADDGLIRDELN